MNIFKDTMSEMTYEQVEKISVAGGNRIVPGRNYRGAWTASATGNRYLFGIEILPFGVVEVLSL